MIIWILVHQKYTPPFVFSSSNFELPGAKPYWFILTLPIKRRKRYVGDVICTSTTHARRVHWRHRLSQNGSTHGYGCILAIIKR